MKTRNWILIVSAILLPDVVDAANTVTIQSKSAPAGAQSIDVGVYITNDFDATVVILPLIFRSTQGGAFIANSFSSSAQGRLSTFEAAGAWSFKRSYAVTGIYAGPNRCSESWNPADSGLNFVSPEAIMYTAIRAEDTAYFRVGSDGAPAGGSPSLKLSFGVGSAHGTFEIDTTCVPPGNNVFLGGGENGDVIVVPTFTKGVVTVGCECNCHADPQCDGYHDIVDWMKVKNVAQGSSPPIPDPNPFCPRVTTDVNCDGVTNNTDKNLMYGVVFLGDDPNQVFCDPCP